MALSKITTESLLDGEITAAKFASGVGGKVVQVVYVQTGAGATGTTVIPQDDTIPQQTEGVEFLTLAITPTHADNILYIESSLNLSPAAAGRRVVALFQDSTAGALAANMAYMVSSSGNNIITVQHKMVAGTTSATTFKVRGGNDAAATITLNGYTGGRKYGGVLSSFLKITEILA